MPAEWRSSQPLVTYLISTYNRRHYLPVALRSALNQTYSNLQIIVVRDGGEEVRDIVESFRDDRILLIDRSENRGLAYSYNEAIPHARGKYIAYLGDDDIHYPEHIETHVSALENNPQYLASYSDLYRTLVIPQPDGSRKVISKSVIVGRGFDKYYQMYYNLVLGGACVHRKDLLERTGPYNESIRVLIDWDMTRRISFFTDFLHLTDITGEFFSNLEGTETDRISDQGRKDQTKYFQNCIAIKNNRPPKPWPNFKDLSIVYLPHRANDEALTRVVAMLQETFTPDQIYLPMSLRDLQELDVSLPHVKNVVVGEDLSPAARLDAVLDQLEGDYVAICSHDVKVFSMWVEHSLFALMKQGCPPMQGRILATESPESWAALVRRDDLNEARAQFGMLPLRKSCESLGVQFRTTKKEESAFRFDTELGHAKRCLKNDKFLEAAGCFERMAREYPDSELFLKVCAAWAMYHDGTCDEKAIRLCEEINRRRPWVDALFVEGKIRKRQGQFQQAAQVLGQAREILNKEG